MSLLHRSKFHTRTNLDQVVSLLHGITKIDHSLSYYLSPIFHQLQKANHRPKSLGLFPFIKIEVWGRSKAGRCSLL